LIAAVELDEELFALEEELETWLLVEDELGLVAVLDETAGADEPPPPPPQAAKHKATIKIPGRLVLLFIFRPFAKNFLSLKTKQPIKLPS
jgi:hypothetical protein